MKSLSILILRLGVGLTMLLAHGLPKFLSYSEKSAVFPDPLGVGSPTSMMLAIFAEMFCSIFLILGLATRLAVIPLMTTMLTAILLIHSSDPWSVKEHPFLYFIPFLSLFFSGGGKFSLSACYSEIMKTKNKTLAWLLG